MRVRTVSEMKECEARSRMQDKQKAKVSFKAACIEQQRASLFGGAHKWKVDWREALLSMASV